jgi:hypothetical protein
MTPSTVCEITFELARHYFNRNFYVLRDLRSVDLLFGLPCLDDEQASPQFGTRSAFTLIDGKIVHTHERRHQCLLLSFGKV